MARWLPDPTRPRPPLAGKGPFYQSGMGKKEKKEVPVVGRPFVLARLATRKNSQNLALEPPCAKKRGKKNPNKKSRDEKANSQK